MFRQLSDSVEHFINPISTGLDRKAGLRPHTTTALCGEPVTGAGGAFSGSPEEQEPVYSALVAYRAVS